MRPPDRPRPEARQDDEGHGGADTSPTERSSQERTIGPSSSTRNVARITPRDQRTTDRSAAKSASSRAVSGRPGRPRPAHPSRSIGVPSASSTTAAGPVEQPVLKQDPGLQHPGNSPRAVPTPSRVPKSANLAGMATQSAVVSDQSEDRFAERDQARRRSARRPFIVAGCVVLVLIMVGWLVLLSPILALDAKRIELKGIAGIVEESVVADIVEKRAGTPLARIDTGAIETELATAPGVRSAAVTRAWPNGLEVVIEARTPVAAVPDDGGVSFVDRDGVRVGRSEVAPDNLPVIKMALDDKRAQRTLNSTLAVLAGIPESLRTQIAEVAATSPDAVRMTLRDGKTVVWGDDKNIALKVAVLESLRAQSAEVSEYDVSAPRAPVTR